MRYFIAREQDTLPSIVFDLIAESKEELQSLGLESSGIIIPESRLLDPEHPDYINYQFGQCSHRIQNNQLVLRDRNATELAYSKSVEVAKTEKFFRAISVNTFSFDGHEFPMTPGAVSYYNALFVNGISVVTPVISVSGVYNLAPSNLDAFKSVYCSKVLSVYSLQVSV